MSIQLATAILHRLGPCPIRLDRTRHAALACELGLLGCAIVDVTDEEPAARPAAAIVEWQADGSASAQLHAYRNADRLIVLPSSHPRTPIEQQIFALGWERHPGDMPDHGYAARDHPALGLTLFRRADPAAALSPLRSSDAQADARIARFAMAARQARPGDRILVDGAASDTGGEIVAALSRAGSIVSDGDPQDIAAHSIDLIVAFDAAAPEGWRSRLDLYAGALKPDGRIVIGWPRGGDDDTAPPSWAAFQDALAERFLIEARYLHTIPERDDGTRRALHPLPIDAPDMGDWLIAVASANPLDGATLRADYRHPAFDHGDGPLPTVVDFGAAYDNPYLYRVMVQMGERLGDETKLARLAEIVSQEAADASADRGAAITVLGYRVLELRAVASVAPLLRMIESYCNAVPDQAAPPHVARWRLSLAFLAGRLSELAGDRRQAIRWFDTAADGDWARFSPLLATKAVAAAFHAGRLHLGDGDMTAARACFRHGLDISLEAAACPHGAMIGNRDRPLPFYMQELAEVIDMGSQCVNALANGDLWGRDPGLFWRQVDMRRFGLASWARDLERENERLRTVARPQT